MAAPPHGRDRGEGGCFIGLSLAASRWLSRPLDLVLDRLPREFFLLGVVAFVVGMAALSSELGLSEAIGALMAGIVLAETSVREEIEERFFSFRDLFGALFFFVFGLSIDVHALGRTGWLLAARSSSPSSARRRPVTSPGSSAVSTGGRA